MKDQSKQSCIILFKLHDYILVTGLSTFCNTFFYSKQKYSKIYSIFKILVIREPKIKK